MSTALHQLRPSSHPYLSGNYAPVHEEVTATDLEVTGTVPDYLDGRYLRTGPTRSPTPIPPPITGSSATEWRTCSGCATAERSGTATGGSGRRGSRGP